MKAVLYLNDGQEIGPKIMNQGAMERVVIKKSAATAARVEISYFKLDQTDMLVGAVLYRKDGRLMAATGLSSDADGRITMPYLVEGDGWWSSLSFYNQADDGNGDDCELKSVTRVRGSSDGEPGADLKLDEEEAKDFWKFPAGSYALDMENPCGLTGVGFLGHGEALGSYCLSSEALKEGELGPLCKATKEGWCGIVLYNPNPASAKVELLAYDAAGKLVAKVVRTIAGHQNLVGLPQTVFGREVSGATHLIYRADQGLLGVLINHNDESGGEKLDVLPVLPTATAQQ
jgi:hypothetical protein